jgi:hypothetical protein
VNYCGVPLDCAGVGILTILVCVAAFAFIAWFTNRR